ncbi:zinc ribbon domain-containing protein [Neorhodopirellula pilleata]|uniref:zinc ribbon domain-containing protein n=1 Tax=Neorhodopirellula pilleata TaxID=2714738 RepID=UPI0011B6F0E9|nr:zinc ribbon domain-containing protein [Neorhodopirellula pilleata]
MNCKDDAPLNQVPCPKCGEPVDDRAVGCPSCGEKIYVEHPADITSTKHPPLSQ